jgi:succinate dehydrogenase flavin-adding protein (antitoxin of CptAB toxin-antitoxin module)
MNTETSGGTRYSEGKPKMTWAPWRGMMEVCRVSDRGAQKYAPLDWDCGQSFSTLLNSASRHMIAAMNNPLARDSESDLLHVGHAAWNLLCLLDFVEQGRAAELDDITKWRGVSASEKEHSVKVGQELPTWAAASSTVTVVVPVTKSA